MTRFPVIAAKDARAPAPLRPKTDHWTSALRRLRHQEGERLVELASALCPHEWLGLESYRSTVLAIDRWADAAEIETMQGGLPLLDEPFGLSFAVLSDGNRVAVLQSLQGTPFFNTALRLVSRHLYDLPEVWAGCGYDGIAGRDTAGRNDFDEATLSLDKAP